jgi:hypothetical protein
MTKWHDVVQEEGKLRPWPYPIRFDKEQEIETDVLVIGGGIAGCWAAISAVPGNGYQPVNGTGHPGRPGGGSRRFQ